MSHEGVIYCKPHHRDLFLPKSVKAVEAPGPADGHSSQQDIICESEIDLLTPR